MTRACIAPDEWLSLRKRDRDLRAHVFAEAAEHVSECTACRVVLCGHLDTVEDDEDGLIPFASYAMRAVLGTAKPGITLTVLEFALAAFATACDPASIARTDRALIDQVLDNVRCWADRFAAMRDEYLKQQGPLA